MLRWKLLSLSRWKETSRRWDIKVKGLKRFLAENIHPMLKSTNDFVRGKNMQATEHMLVGYDFDRVKRR